MTEKMIDDSSFEVLRPATPRHSGDDLFQSQVLSILHNLKEDFQNMSDRVTKLEDHRAQSTLSDETQSVNSKPSKPQEDGEPAVHSTPWADVDPNEKPDFFLHTKLGRGGGKRSENNRGEALQNLREDRSLFEAKLHVHHPQPTAQTVEREDWGPEHPVHSMSLNGQTHEVSPVGQCKDSGQNPGQAPSSYIRRCGSDHPYLRGSCQRPAHP